MTAQTLTTRINELSTKRLLPFEMIAFLNNHRPAEVVFRRVSTVGLHAIRVEAYTSAFPAVSTFESALKALPECERVELTVLPGGDNLMTFELTATFRPDALKPDPNP